MGKDLHYSIRPFIEKAILQHSMVSGLEEIKDDLYYAYRIRRRNRMRDVILVLSDAYNADVPDYDLQLFNQGGFYLIARPEASNILDNDFSNKIITGKLSILLGALNKDKFWEYKPPIKKKGNQSQ